VGQAAPDFALKTLEGTVVRLSELRNKVVLINFWATWCAPCRLEMPAMQQMHAEYQSKGFEVLAINIESDADKEVRDFVKELRLMFPILLDPDMQNTQAYQAMGLPISFLVDRHGVIRSKTIGYHDWKSKETRHLVEQLLAS
jgi:peroxiredoxin